VDTYLDGCTHNCLYCYARDQATKKGKGGWNHRSPRPLDIGEIRDIFYTVFETDKKNKWRNILTQKIPLRLGGYTDCFMEIERHNKITLELLKLLNYYQYPYLIVTKSGLVAQDEYISEIDPRLAGIQLTIPSLNRDFIRVLEPGAPGISTRLDALKKLTAAGFWVGVRINPLFPVYPDGYYSDPGFDRSRQPGVFDYFDYQLVDVISQYGGRCIIAGFVHLSPAALARIESKLNFPLGDFMKPANRETRNGFFYSKEEIRAYYERIQKRCLKNNIQFTTCYLGFGESHYWENRYLWANKRDCCNAAGKVAAFKKTAQNIGLMDRLKAFDNPGKGFKRLLRYLGLIFLNLILKELTREKKDGKKSSEK
jgi:DNA repair photolyase